MAISCSSSPVFSGSCLGDAPLSGGVESSPKPSELDITPSYIGVIENAKKIVEGSAVGVSATGLRSCCRRVCFRGDIVWVLSRIRLNVLPYSLLWSFELLLSILSELSSSSVI